MIFILEHISICKQVGPLIKVYFKDSNSAFKILCVRQRSGLED